MKRADIISLERCIEKSKNRNRAIQYGEGFSEKVNRYNAMKNNKQIDRAKKEIVMENKYGE